MATATAGRTAARRAGRPTRDEAARLGERITAVATELVLRDGFAATSIEAVAAACGISKRTFYHRFRDKPALFRAVVHGLIARWTPPFEAALEVPRPLDAMLAHTARQILAAALSPEALALYRMMIAEAPRFPELARILNEQSRGGIERIARLLEAEAQAGRMAHAPDALFAAEQFLNLVLAAPRRRALGLGAPMNEAEITRWIERTVALFLDGCRG